MEKKKRFVIATLGCRTNQYESAAYAKQLRELGYEEAQEGEAADLCIVNTCTVTESADSSSRREIRKLARAHSGGRILVTGCLADRAFDELTQIEGVETVVRNKEKEGLLKLVHPEGDLPEFAIDSFGGHTRAFVKVQDGCNSFCTYCIIPYVRGRSRSRRLESVVKEVKELIQNGYKEVVITGINVGDFDGAPEEGEAPLRLSGLVRAIDQIEGLERLRISSIDPDEVDDDLLDAVINGKRTCHSLHIVLQAGSNAILKRMNRKYTRQMFLEAVEKCKQADPDFTFTTDVIVGFPGETEADFQETLDLIEQVRFAKVHMFPYSKRERTKAAQYLDSIPDNVKQERKQKVLKAAEKVAYHLRAAYVGRSLPVLLESADPHDPSWITGHTENFLFVRLRSEGLQPNEIIEVTFVENRPDGLIGERCR